MDMEIFTCDTCHYTFAGQSDCDQCPDCGKKQIRIATEQEQQEYLEHQKNQESWN